MSRLSALLKAACFVLVLQCVVLLTPSSAVAQEPSASKTTQAVPTENPYGLKAVWAQGDVVAKGTLCILVFMSVASWYLIFSKLLEQTRMMAQQRAAMGSLSKESTLDQATQTLQTNSPFRYVAQEAVSSAARHRDMGNSIDFNEWVMLSLQRANTSVGQSMQKGLSFLATVGSTAPFVGLFGTVWGIYNALVSIGMSGQASIDKVAGPVGEALIMTAIGLAVAVPAVLGYNFLVRRNKSSMEEVRAFAADLHSVVLSGNMSKVAKKAA